MSWIEDPGVDVFLGLDLRELSVDEAYVRVRSDVPVSLYSLAQDCHKCSFSAIAEVSNSSDALKVSTRDSYTWRLLSNSTALCETSANLGEFGVYELTVGNATCTLTTLLHPVNVYYPLVLCVLSLALLFCVPVVLRRFLRRKHVVDTTLTPDVPGPESTSVRRRLKALDTFRGISVVIMIFVNYGAGSYWFFDHATWDGLRIADLVFPWFLWIMGVCMPISVNSQLRKDVPRRTMLVAILRRSCILFLLGLILSTKGVGADLEKIRLFGVLQRFSVTYLVVAVVLVGFTRRSASPSKNKALAALQDLIVLLPHWMLMAFVVAGYCVLIFMLEVPGCPRGYLGPGGLHEYGRHKHCVGGATGYVDRLVLGEAHLYQRPTAEEVYGSGAFDPEGLVGCLPSVFQVFLGVQAGTTLVTFRSWKAHVVRWLSWGVLCGAVGAVLSLGGWIPLNKNLWSLSFVFVTSSSAFFLLTLCYVLIDVKRWWNGAPFFYPGMNATIMYVGHSLCYDVFPWHWAVGRMNTHFLRLVENLWGTALWVVVAVWLYRIKFFLSL